MKHLLISCSLVLISFFSASSQTTKKVLFLGNSYTAVNNLPLMIDNMAISTGDGLIYDSNTPGGYRLMNHASNTTTLNKINSNNWDYVVLQAQSQETSWGQSQMEAELYPYAESLSNAIRANNECSQPMFYMTWGRENGDSANCNSAPWVCTYEGMDDAIRATYVLMADTNDAEVAPVGAVWRYLRTNHPNIDLYSSDGSHPSLAGSYAAACAFYTMVYKKDPTLITWNSTLSETDANAIKMAAKTIVFDNVSNWDFTINPAVADYSEVINAAEVSFTSTSSEYDALLWDFGDGNTSTDMNPIHTYQVNGNYTVSLTIYKCGESDIKIKAINIDVSLGIEEVDLESPITIFPNPTSKFLHIKLNRNYNEITVMVFDVLGKSVLEKIDYNASNLSMDISGFSNGIYTLNILLDNKLYSKKISKFN